MLGGTFGIGRYVEKLVLHLEKLDHENEYVIFLRKGNWNTWSPLNPKFKKSLADIPWYSGAEQFILPRIFYKERCDIMHFPHWNVPLLYRRLFVMTIHDLTMVRLPESSRSSVTTRHPVIHAAKHACFRFVLRSSIARARHLLVVSEAVFGDLAHTFPASAAKASVVHEAADPCTDTPVKPPVALPKRYFLYVGSCYPHKNLIILLDVWRRLRDEDPECVLLLCGQEDAFTARVRSQIEERGVSGSVRHLGTVTDAELSYLYQHALALISASRAEGFGLQLLEAMHCGTPVVCSDVPSFREVAGAAALYFNPASVDDILSKVRCLMRDVSARAELSQKGLKQAQRFSWEKTAQSTKKIYEQQS